MVKRWMSLSLDGEVHINGAKILARDKQGPNGAIHSNHAVNLPSE